VIDGYNLNRKGMNDTLAALMRQTRAKDRPATAVTAAS